MKIDAASTASALTQQQNISETKPKISAVQTDPQTELELQKAVKFGYVKCNQPIEKIISPKEYLATLYDAISSLYDINFIPKELVAKRPFLHVLETFDAEQTLLNFQKCSPGELLKKLFEQYEDWKRGAGQIGCYSDLIYLVNCLQVLTTEEIPPDSEPASSEVDRPSSKIEKKVQKFLGQLVAVAIVADNYPVLRLLLEFECSLDVYSLIYIDPPIILAAKHNNLAAIELLLNHLRQLDKAQQEYLISLIEKALKISVQQKNTQIVYRLTNFLIEFNSQ